MRALTLAEANQIIEGTFARTRIIPKRACLISALPRTYCDSKSRT
jgi:hypothetical protein